MSTRKKVVLTTSRERAARRRRARHPGCAARARSAPRSPPSTSVAGRRVERDLARRRTRSRRRRSPGCTARWRRAPRWSRRRWRLMAALLLVAGDRDGRGDDHGGPAPSGGIDSAVARCGRDDVGGCRGLGQRRIERPERRPRAGQADRPAERPAQRRRNGTSPGTTSDAPAAGRWPRRARRPGRRGRPPSGPSRSSSARCSSDIRTAPSPCAAHAVERGEDVGRRTATAGVTSRTPGRPWSAGSGVTCSPRPSTSAGRRPRKNGTSEPRLAATRVRGAARPARHPTPRARRRARRRRRTSRRQPAATGCACRGGRRARAPAGPPGPPPPTAARAAASARSTRLSPAARRRDPSTWSVSADRATGRREAEPVGEGEGHEHRVQRRGSRPPAADDGQGQVDLGRGEADDRGEAPERVALTGPSVGRADRGPIGPSASRSASHSSTASVWGRRSGAMPAAPGPPSRAPADAAAGATARCGSSCAAPGRRPGRGARARPRRPASRRSSASYGSTTITADSTSGSGSKARRRARASAIADPRVVLHEHRQVAHLPGRRRDPLRDLALDHQHEARRARRLARAARGGSGW